MLRKDALKAFDRANNLDAIKYNLNKLKMISSIYFKLFFSSP